MENWKRQDKRGQTNKRQEHNKMQIPSICYCVVCCRCLVTLTHTLASGFEKCRISFAGCVKTARVLGGASGA